MGASSRLVLFVVLGILGGWTSASSAAPAGMPSGERTSESPAIASPGGQDQPPSNSTRPSRKRGGASGKPARGSGRSALGNDETEGGFKELRKTDRNSRTSEPEEMGTPLAKDRREVDGLGVTEIGLPAAEILPCMTLSPDGDSVFIAEKGGSIHRIATEGFIEQLRLDTRAGLSWLSPSAEGLLATAETTQQVLILDLSTLRIKGRIAVPSAGRAVSSYKTSLAYATGGRRSDSQLSVLDLKQRKIIRQYGGRDFEEPNIGFKNVAITPDGKFLFTESLEHLQRFRVRDDALEPQQRSERIAQNGQSIEISPDGYYVALPSGGGNYGEAKPYSTFIYKVNDLSKPAITINSGAYPRTIAFDMKGGLIYAQNFEFAFMAYTPTGIKQIESKLGDRRGLGETKQFLVLPGGRRLLVLTARSLLFVELPDQED